MSPSAENAPQRCRVDVVADVNDESDCNLVPADTRPFQPPTSGRKAQPGEDELTGVSSALGPFQRKRAVACKDAVRFRGDIREGAEPTAPHTGDLRATVERCAR